MGPSTFNVAILSQKYKLYTALRVIFFSTIITTCHINQQYMSWKFYLFGPFSVVSSRFVRHSLTGIDVYPLSLLHVGLIPVIKELWDLVGYVYCCEFVISTYG
jgi:hypothetical protein